MILLNCPIKTLLKVVSNLVHIRGKNITSPEKLLEKLTHLKRLRTTRRSFLAVATNAYFDMTLGLKSLSPNGSGYTHNLKATKDLNVETVLPGQKVHFQ